MTQRSRRGTGSIYCRNGSDIYWVKFYCEGKLIRQSSGKTTMTEAQKFLDDLRKSMGEGEPLDHRKLTVADLFEDLMDEYRNEERNDIVLREERRWKKRLEKHFGHIRARNLTSPVLNKYVTWAKNERHLTGATINRDLAILKHAFYVAKKATPPKVHIVPTFPHLKESKPRSGFVREAEFQRLISYTGKLWVRALVMSAYTYGFRKGELLELRCDQVSLIDRTINLNPGETKNDEGRIAPLTDDLFALFQILISGKKSKDAVFTREDGSPVKDFRDEWYAICCAAGLGKILCPKCSNEDDGILAELNQDHVCPQCGKKFKDPKYVGLIFHDLRRCAVRNMVRRGVAQKVAMRISGHKTASVFDRYNIVDETDLRDAVAKITAGARLEFGHNLGTTPPENGAIDPESPAPKGPVN